MQQQDMSRQTSDRTHTERGLESTDSPLLYEVGRGQRHEAGAATSKALKHNEQDLPGRHVDSDTPRMHIPWQEPPDPESQTSELYRYKGVSPDVPRTSLRVRLRGFTLAWFTICMATAGLAILLGRVPGPYRFHGIRTLGRIVFIIDLVLFVMFHFVLGYRFYLYPPAMKTALIHPIESSYLCAWLQAYAAILTCCEIYAIQETGFWFRKTLLVLWLIDVVFAAVLSLYLPLIHFVDYPHAHKKLPPSFLLLPTIVIYASTVGSGLVGQLSLHTAIWVYWLSWIMLGWGMFMFIFYLALWFVKLLAGGLYQGKHAVTPFMIVGMTSYTAQGFFSLGRAAVGLFPKVSAQKGVDYMGGTGTVNGVPVLNTGGGSVQSFGVLFGLLFYGFTWWCLLVSVTMTIRTFHAGRASPSLSAMFSVAFPTTGIIVDTWDVAVAVGWSGDPPGSRWLDILGLVMLVIWIMGYLGAVAGLTYKVYAKKLLWEGKDDNAPAMHYTGEFDVVPRKAAQA